MRRLFSLSSTSSKKQQQNNNTSLKTIRTYFDEQSQVMYYHAKDIASSLGYADHKHMVKQHVKPDQKLAVTCATTSGFQKATFISEEAYDNLKRRSNKHAAQKNIETLPTSIRYAVADGQVWYSAKDLSKQLGYKNPTVFVQTHVKPTDQGLIDFQTANGTRKMLAVNEKGKKMLINTAKTRNEFKSSRHRLKTISTQVQESQPTLWQTDPARWLWLPSGAEDFAGEDKTAGTRVLFYQTQESNALLRGGANNRIKIEDIYAEQDLPMKEPTAFFGKKGHLILPRQDPDLYAQAKQAFDSMVNPSRIPAPYQFTLDLILSDYIEALRRHNGITSQKTRVLEGQTLNPCLLDKEHPVWFNFSPIDWFSAFYYIQDGQPRPRTPARMIFGAWVKEILSSLEYLIQHGVIWPCEELSVTTDESTALIREMCKESIPVLGKVESKLWNPRRKISPYSYQFILNPAWSRDIGSTSIGTPLRIPPIIGRMAAGGMRMRFRYTANRLLCTMAFTRQNKIPQEGSDSNKGYFKISLRSFCNLLGLPMFDEDWVKYHRLRKKLSVEAAQQDYVQRIIINTLEAYGLFRLQKLTWNKRSPVDAKRKLPPANAMLTIKALYRF